MTRYGFFAVGFCLFLHSAIAQTAAPAQDNGDRKAQLQAKLESQFQRTKITSNRSDIVKAGSVLVLNKDALLMCSVDTNVPPTNNYNSKSGKISMSFSEKLMWGMALNKSTDQVPQRKFVAGEKFWVTDFSVKDEGVVLRFYSDPYKDVRYYGDLAFPFPKHAIPPVDEVMKTIAEAISVQPDDSAAGNSSGNAPGAGSRTRPAPTQTSMAPIAPPPPPPDAPPPQPKTIALGMTRDQVVAIMGQPQKVVNLNTKEIDYYSDMKVVFLKGKVSDVQ